MAIHEKYLKELWNSVWKEELTELQVQKRYFAKLDKELEGEDRFHLHAVRRKIVQLEMEQPFSDSLVGGMKIREDNKNSIGLQNSRIDGDGTEWIIEKDEDGNIYKRELGSDKKFYINK